MEEEQQSRSKSWGSTRLKAENGERTRGGERAGENEGAKGIITRGRGRAAIEKDKEQRIEPP